MVHIVSFGCLHLIKVMVLHCYLVAIILIVVVDKKMFRVLVFDSILKETCPGFYMTVFYYCLYRPSEKQAETREKEPGVSEKEPEDLSEDDSEYVASESDVDDDDENWIVVGDF